MKKILLIAMLALSSSVASAQQIAADKEITLKVTAADVPLIGKALESLPYKDVAGLMQKLQMQINMQTAPAPGAAVAAPVTEQPPKE